MRIFFFFSSFVVVVGVVLALAMPADAATNKRKNAGPNQKYAAIVIDAETGETLVADYPDRQLHPASLTKMMTLLLAFDALNAGQMKTNDYIRVSQNAAGQTPSKLGVRAGGRLRVDDAIRSIAVKSANDISVAMAEALAGSESAFARRMTERARGLGMMRTRFVNASGLHHPSQVSTARDMATLARYIIETYPKYYRYFGLRNFQYGGRSHPNHNRLMNSYAGMDGMKTGYIRASGFNLVASAVRNDRRIIGVVFGGRTANSRNAHMAKILDTAFAKPRRKITPKIDVARLPALKPSDDVVLLEEEGSRDATQPTRRDLSSMDGFQAHQIRAGKVVPGRKPGAFAVSSINPQAGSRDRGYVVQIGAYTSRDATDLALNRAQQKLPGALSHATPIVAPLKSLNSGWMFRARLGNLNAAEAAQACRVFSGCLIIPPTGI